jgi:hypothetical protein
VTLCGNVKSLPEIGWVKFCGFLEQIGAAVELKTGFAFRHPPRYSKELSTTGPKLSTGYPQYELLMGLFSLTLLDKGIMPGSSKRVNIYTGRW